MHTDLSLLLLRHLSKRSKLCLLCENNHLSWNKNALIILISTLTKADILVVRYSCNRSVNSTGAIVVGDLTEQTPDLMGLLRTCQFSRAVPEGSMVGAVSTGYCHSLYNKRDKLALTLQLNWLYFQQSTTCKHLRVTMSN